MNRKRIEQLARILPGDAAIFTAGLKPQDPALRPAEQLAIAASDPAFCYHLIMEFVARNEPLPVEVCEACLRRAFNHYATNSGLPDSVNLQVEQLSHPARRIERNVLQALLISRDCSYTQIANWLDLGEPAVKLYEILHWNVRHRSAEAAYIAGLVFPEGRVALLKTGAAESLPFEARLLIAGHLYGAKEVLWLAGINTADAQPPSANQSRKDFEQTVLENAVQLARSGALNSKSAPGIAHAKTIIAAEQSRESAGNPATSHNSNNISISDAILLSMGNTPEQAAKLAEEGSAFLAERLAEIRELEG